MPRAKSFDQYPSEFWDLLERFTAGDKLIRVPGKFGELVSLRQSLYNFAKSIRNTPQENMRKIVLALHVRPLVSSGSTEEQELASQIAYRAYQAACDIYMQIDREGEDSHVLVITSRSAGSKQARLLRKAIGAKAIEQPPAAVMDSQRRLLDLLKGDTK